MLDLLIHDATVINPRIETGDMVLISELREVASWMTPEEFDRTLLEGAAKRVVALHKFDRPLMISDEERAKMLTDEDGTYNTISLYL